MRNSQAGDAGCICRTDIGGHTVPDTNKEYVSSRAPPLVQSGGTGYLYTGRGFYLLFPSIARDASIYLALPLTGHHRGVALDAVSVTFGGTLECLEALHSLRTPQLS